MINLDFLQGRYKNLIFAIVLAVIFLLDFVVLLKPQIGISGKLGAKVSALKKDLKSAKKDIASQKEFSNKLNQLKEKAKVIGSTVTPEEELPSVLEGISRRANQDQVKITQIKPLKEEKTALLKAGSGIYYQIPILIDAQCGYHALGKFLYDLESEAAFLKVIGLEVKTNPADIARHLIRLTVQTFILGK